MGLVENEVMVANPPEKGDGRHACSDEDMKLSAYHDNPQPDARNDIPRRCESHGGIHYKSIKIKTATPTLFGLLQWEAIKKAMR